MAALPGSFLVNPLFQMIAFGAGTAMGPVLAPTLQELHNETWALHPSRRPSAVLLSQGVAQGQVSLADATQWARETGYSDDRWQAMIDIANVGPGLTQAYRMWRRGQIGEPGFRRAVKRLGLEQEWIDDLVALVDERLDPAQLAVMIQRTVVPNPGILPNQPDTAGSNVPPMPMVDLDVVKEAAAAGIDKDRLSAMARIIGLPASPDLAARMHFRNIITEGAFNQAILEGNTRGEWAPFLLEGFRQILTANQYTELELRGFIDAGQRRAFTDQHGMSHEDSDRLLEVLGRSITTHQIVTAQARGGKFPGNYDNVPQPFRQAIQRSNIREEYSELAYANRYTYPSFFAIRGLLQGGVLSADAGYQLLLEMGWKPSLARTVADFYGDTAAVTTGPLVKSAVTQAVTEIRSAYLIGQADGGTARGWLGSLGVTALDQAGLLKVWDVMREVPQKGLTAAQIKKASRSLPAQWPRDRALDELVLLGYTRDDAATFLDE